VIALGCGLPTPTFAQPAPFSGAQCSMTNCDCTCIAAVEGKGADALERLTVRRPTAVFRAPRPMPPEEALALLQRLRERLDRVQMVLKVDAWHPLAVPLAAGDWQHMNEIFADLGLAPLPAGGKVEPYLESLSRQVEGELSRVTDRVAVAKEVSKEIDTCRQWADHKRCDPSLGTQPRTPPREQPPAEGALPIRRHADGRPYVNDDLISRYVAASQAKVREGGAYWRQGRMGQAEYDEISGRFQEYFRYENGPEINQRFDDVEVEAITRRRAEVNKAYYENW
jgi:hypothetical protein